MGQSLGKELQALSQTTRVFLASARTVLGLAGAGAYRLASGELAKVPYAATDILEVFYEVGVTSLGSWWLPTLNITDPQWQDSEPLDADGMIVSTGVLRPTNLFWFIPEESLVSQIRPERTFGVVEGDFPDRLPPQFTG